MDKRLRRKLSKFMSLILRHRPEVVGIELERDGFVGIEELAGAISSLEQWSWVKPEHIMEVAREDEKGRFEIKGGKIRARYGHSIPLVLGYKPVEPPEFLYHGTARRNLEKIKKEGLRPMERNFVHLSPDLETAQEVGRRWDKKPVILKIKARAAFKKGIFFTKAGPKTYLSEPIPPEFIILPE